MLYYVILYDMILYDILLPAAASRTVALVALGLELGETTSARCGSHAPTGPGP